MIEAAEKTFFFGDFELSGAKRTLLKRGENVSLNSKTFDLLLTLIENRGRVLSKDELLETVWEGQFVEENNLTVQISALRKIFGEKKNEHRFIVTIPGKGYKFVGGETSLAVANHTPKPTIKTFGNNENIIGREAEIAEIKSILRESNKCLLTLTGAGGSGKTKLARTIADELQTEFAGGVFFVELAAVRQAEQVSGAIAQVLDVKESGEKSLLETLQNFLRERVVLLVLDNFEQLLSAADVIKNLLDSAENLKILVTSRTLLHLKFEQEKIVLPLNIPPPNSNLSAAQLAAFSAVELFALRAQTAKTSFALNEENASVIAEICNKLDGLPLAIELAAARIKLLSPQSILERLENSLKLLTGGAKDLPERQQTMRGTIQWSYDLLDEDEKNLFRRLAVFAGGFTVEAAEFLSEPLAVADGSDSVLDILTKLIDNNLLICKEQTDGDARLQMLEVVREFAAECLETSGKAENLRRRHSEFFLALAEEIEPLLLTEKVVKALEKFDAELDNFRAALRWLLSREIEMMVRMTAALRQFWYNRCYLTEARQWLETALAKSDVKPHPIRLKLLNAISLVTRTQGDYAATRRTSEESLSASREIKDLRQIILACHAVAGLEIRENNLTKARKLYEESLVISRELNDERQIAFTLSGLSNVLLNEGNGSAARPLLEEALVISRRMGFKFNLSTDLINLGAVNYYESDADAAYRNFAESLAIAREIKSTAYISCCLDGFAAVAAISKNPEQSARLAGAAESLRESIGYEIESTERIFRDDYLKKVLAGFDRKSFAAAYQEGQNLDLNEALELAESLSSGEQFNEIIIETHQFSRILIEEEN
jgi:predicted ATPase/DNA-binding winged helix-turn-helix (wHTH) protein